MLKKFFSSSAPQAVALDRRDADALEELLYADTLGNLYAIEHYDIYGLPPASASGARVTGNKLPAQYRGFVGIYEDGILLSALLLGSNTVPIWLPDDDRMRSHAEVLAHLIYRSRGSIESLFGPSECVLPIWEHLRKRLASPFSVRTVQPLLYLPPEKNLFSLYSASLPELPGYLPSLQSVPESPGGYVRCTVLSDYDDVLPAAAAMFHEEVGIEPIARYGSNYRNRVRSMVSEGKNVIVTNDLGVVVFKADLGISHLDAAQIQGVWVHPDYRGLGLAAPFLAAACELFRERHPHLSLYVNNYNDRALSLYQRTGWEDIGQYSTIIFTC